ncbi:hypothetical protein LCGC14_1561510 [marine sediment metagenome]|uniref:Uncharacterized protein n=1 Tax=marine sediment metagenome TaxID=412755 RepID=A0A0F9J8C4_9ZZZZ
MDAKTLLIIVLIMFNGLIFYSSAKLQNKIYCSFRRIDKTKIEKFVPKDARYVIFDKGRYKIDTKRITLLWWNRGFSYFFPQKVSSLDFSWYSEVPHDPDNFEDTWDTPEARNAASSEEDWKGFNKGMAQQIGKKAGAIVQYLPYIMVMAFVILAFLYYSQTQRIDILEQMIRATTPNP